MLDSKLVEHLLDLENPLITQFKNEASGTFYHSEKVRNLLEKLGRALKLDVEFLKIIGLYHDIGKMRFPLCYCENQPKDTNMHDTLPPEISFHLITSHIANSVSVLVNYMPDIDRSIINCISMHHGNTILKSIWNKIDISIRDTVIDAYRYPYSKPTDVHACALMICDTVEATTKAMTIAGSMTTDNTEQTIKDIVQRLIAEQQLDALTIGQHRTITNVLVEEYLSGEQKRISAEYETEAK